MTSVDITVKIFCVILFYYTSTEARINKCIKNEVEYFEETVCDKYNFGVCVAERVVKRTRTVEKEGCCAGWEGQNCNSAICSPTCRNGGTCIGPNKCRCPPGFKGDICNGGCNSIAEVDIIFMVDESGSVGTTSFRDTMSSLSKTVDKLAIRDDLFRVGMALFDSSPRTRFNLDYSFNKATLKREIMATSFKSGGTNIGKALRYACDDMFVVSKGDRPEAQNVLVLLTDGHSSENKRQALQKCQNKNVMIIAVGIGDGIDDSQLQRLVSTPEYFFKTTYLALESKLPDLVTKSVDCSTFDQSCSHVQPCYPGKCSGSTNHCTCSKGFEGPSCLKMTGDGFKPTIEKSNASFIQFSYEKDEEEYRYMADATGKTETDITWTNQEKFNKIKINIEASINSNDAFASIPRLPYYIGEFKLGIVAATIKVLHEKLSKGGSHITVTDKTHSCNEPSNRNPIANRVMGCKIEDRNDVQFDSGDRYQLRFSVSVGGYRKLIDLARNHVKTDHYADISTESVMEFRFDYTDPEHCIESNTCTGNQMPLELESDITRNPIKPKWSGWKDNLSGLQKYSFEVWKMEYSLDNNGLKEPDINTTYNPVPLFIKEVDVAEPIQFPSYEPLVPGVYSTILEVNDKANNSRYARRITIFDKTSQITIRNSHPIIVSSASQESNYTWQTNLDSVVRLSWEKHFINEPHERGHFLARILDYEARLDDGVKRHHYKKINPLFDDNFGKRNKSRIPNFNSIVRFETKVENVHQQFTIEDWNEVRPLKESHEIDLKRTVKDGDAFKLWVMAFDIMGNQKTDSVVLNYDSTKPILSEPEIELNVPDGLYPFSSRIILRAEDTHSGLRKVSVNCLVEGNSEDKNEKEIIIQKKTDDACSSGSDCFCTAHGDCYPKIITKFDINNCWVKVSKEALATKMDIFVYNSAMLYTMKEIQLKKTDKLNGIQEYFSPSNIAIRTTADTSINIEWTQAPSCYERAGILIKLYDPSNSSSEYKVHKEATTYVLSGLSPSTSYWMEMFTTYGNATHNEKSVKPAILFFKTSEEPKAFPIAAAVGPAGGFIILLIVVIIALVVLGRKGKLQPAKQKMTAGIRTIRNTIKVNNVGNGYNNRAMASKEDDDIYFYGGMDLMKIQNHSISRKDISLECEIARGKFAIIYLAKYYDKSEVRTVAAKTAKDDLNEEAVIKMRAKINFYGTKVGHHRNVLDFIGNVEDEVRGPIMLLEYCEKGVLKNFLENSKSKATVDLDERLCRIAFGICQGMDYLSSNQVVHRRLAARNILLDEQCEPKISGFGPDPDIETENQSGSERIPIKWMAPECMKSTKQANELSDVWSFGIVMWEIFSLGDTPYPDIQSRDVLGKVRQGYKMKKPEYCDDAFYAIMLKCWHYDPRKRGGFTEIKDKMNAMFTTDPGEDDYYYYSRHDI